MKELSLKDKSYEGSTFQIVTSVKLNNIIEKLNEIATALNIAEIQN